MSCPAEHILGEMVPFIRNFLRGSLVTLMSAGIFLPSSVARKKRPQNDGLTTARSKQRNSHSSGGEFSQMDVGKLFVCQIFVLSCVDLTEAPHLLKADGACHKVLALFHSIIISYKSLSGAFIISLLYRSILGRRPLSDSCSKWLLKTCEYKENG